MKVFSYNQIVSNRTTQSKFNAICRNERIKTLTELSMDLSHRPSHMGRESTIRQCKRWKCWQSAKPV